MKSGISQKLKKQRIYNMNEQQLRDLIAQTEATKLPGYQTTLKMLRRRLQELILDKQTTASGINKDPDSGLFIAPDGRSYETLEEAEMAVEEEERKGKLDTAKAESQQSIEELERLIKGSGARQKALAERVGARQQGQLLSQLERSILGSGGDAQVVGALTPQIQEQGERSLLDRVQGIEASTLGRLTQVPQLELGNITDMAQLGQSQQRISDARTQALMAEETRRAQIQAGFDSQPEWWEGIVGAAGTALGTAVGGPIGGAIGGALTSAFTRKPSAPTDAGSPRNASQPY
jgi:hypothetical protein